MGDGQPNGQGLGLATHEMQFARDVASCVYFLADGEVHESGPPAELFNHPQKPRTRAFLKRMLGDQAAIAAAD